MVFGGGAGGVGFRKPSVAAAAQSDVFDHKYREGDQRNWETDNVAHFVHTVGVCTNGRWAWMIACERHWIPLID